MSPINQQNKPRLMTINILNAVKPPRLVLWASCLLNDITGSILPLGIIIKQLSNRPPSTVDRGLVRLQPACSY